MLTELHLYSREMSTVTWLETPKGISSEVPYGSEDWQPPWVNSSVPSS